jgi:oligoribonuclease
VARLHDDWLDPRSNACLEIAVIVTGPPSGKIAPKALFQVISTQSGMRNWTPWTIKTKGTHGKSGLIDKVKASTLSEAEAEQ